MCYDLFEYYVEQSMLLHVFVLVVMYCGKIQIIICLVLLGWSVKLCWLLWRFIGIERKGIQIIICIALFEW